MAGIIIRGKGLGVGFGGPEVGEEGATGEQLGDVGQKFDAAAEVGFPVWAIRFLGSQGEEGLGAGGFLGGHQLGELQLAGQAGEYVLPSADA